MMLTSINYGRDNINEIKRNNEAVIGQETEVAVKFNLLPMQ